MPSCFPPMFLPKPPLKSSFLLLFLSLIDGASNLNGPLDPGSVPGLGKEARENMGIDPRLSVRKQPLPFQAPFAVGQNAVPEPQLPELPYAPLCSDPKIACRDLSAHCFACDNGKLLPPNCTYGEMATYRCVMKDKNAHCEGEKEFEKVAECRYCYQTDITEHNCISTSNCHVAGHPYNRRFRTNCTVNHDVVCLGHRTFYKTDLCNYSTGYRWSTTMLLSITVGGFGGDRFYLGHWREGTGKLFSFGGLGVWTIVDIILIAIGYVRPDDGSFYIDL